MEMWKLEPAKIFWRIKNKRVIPTMKIENSSAFCHIEYLGSVNTKYVVQSFS